MDLLSTIHPLEVKRKINELIREVNRLTPVAGSGISIARYPSGTVVSATGSGSGSGVSPGSDEYNGPFTVELIQEEDKQLVRCRDGQNENSACAGYIRVGSLLQAVEVRSWDVKSGIVYAEVLYEDSESEDGKGSYTIDIYFEESLPEDSDPKRWILRIAEVACDENDTCTVSQIWENGDVEVSGRWVR